MTDVDKIVVWLREAMDAARRLAEAAAEGTGSASWEYQAHGSLEAAGPAGSVVAVGSQDHLGPKPGTFMAANDPAAVLVRIDADRKQLDEHHPVPDHGRFSHSYGTKCPISCEGECRSEPQVCLTCRDSSGDPIEAPCNSMMFLAEGYGWKAEQSQ